MGKFWKAPKHYLDASAVAFYALSYGLQSKGVGEDNFGLALRHDTYRSASFSIMLGEGHDKDSGDAAYALGECSYKVFLDIGGTPKTRAQKYPDNSFRTSFVVFPGSSSSQLLRISVADSASDFGVFLALQAEADTRVKGSSGLTAFQKYVSGGRKDLPANFNNIVWASRPWAMLRYYLYSCLS